MVIKIRRQFPDYNGKMCNAPRDLSVKLFIHEDGLIVWSYCPLHRIHQVRYGLQVREFTDSMAAAVKLAWHLHSSCNRVWRVA